MLMLLVIWVICVKCTCRCCPMSYIYKKLCLSTPERSTPERFMNLNRVLELTKCILELTDHKNNHRKKVNSLIVIILLIFKSSTVTLKTPTNQLEGVICLWSLEGLTRIDIYISLTFRLKHHVMIYDLVPTYRS